MTRQLLAFSVVMLLAAPLFADEETVKEPQAVALKEVDTVKLENYQLKITLKDRDLRATRSAAEGWVSGLFNKYKLSPKEWRLDVNRGIFVKVVKKEEAIK